MSPPCRRRIAEGRECRVGRRSQGAGNPCHYSNCALRPVGFSTVTAISFTDCLASDVDWRDHPDRTPLSLIAQKASISGSSYDRQESVAAISGGVGEVYRAKGTYLDAKVEASQLPHHLSHSEAVRIPFRMSVRSGPLYKVESIHLSVGPNCVTGRFRQAAPDAPLVDVASAEHICANWHFIERQYHNRGFMRAQVKPIATLDRSSDKGELFGYCGTRPSFHNGESHDRKRK